MFYRKMSVQKFRSLIERFSSKQKNLNAIAIGLYTLPIDKPVALAERLPEDSDLDEYGRCLYGCWNGLNEFWCWDLQKKPLDIDTHWLPFDVQVAPHKLFKP
jgi:hypothetical protein